MLIKLKLIVLLPLLVVLAGIGLFLNWQGIEIAKAQVAPKTIWCNPANTGAEDGLTKATGYKTIYTASTKMAPGDILIVANGDWSTYSGMSIDNSDGGSRLAPSGIDVNHLTTIKAETDWGVKLNRLSDQGTGRNYMMIRGIVFMNGGGLYKWNYSKIVRCGFFMPKVTGNQSTFSIGWGAHDNLIEECVAWGGGRYKFMDYQGNHNIFRRCVARHDWYISPEWAGQETNFRGYGTHDDIWQNDISIDSDRKEYTEVVGGAVENADFWVGDQYGANGNIIDGCMAIKGMYNAYYFAGTDSGNDIITLKNSIALGPSLEGVASLTGALTCGTPQITAENSLFYNFKIGQQTFTTHNKGVGSLSIKNSIVRDTGPKAYGTDDYMYYFNVASGTFGSHSVNADPFISGLKYPVRVEAGSPLATAGSDGEPIGPTILKKIGVSGTSYGEPGWDQVTDENLWPFPNENKIKELMSTTVEGVPGIYGFTAYQSPFGSPNTLTSY
ncbi:MAG: hypothetical protein PHE77_02190, partial [Candidatus Pacebacteria bacterium]|nr:hypothetical protein [Candidatus Paceibacterota bacterium]